MITILGPTATGKTRLAAELAYRIDGEIISADSRQVYRGMDTGTGKDYKDYIVNGREIPFHLIDIVDPGYEYNVFEFQRDVLKNYQDIKKREKTVILCGGTGLYLESVIERYPLHQVPVDQGFRSGLNSKSMEELVEMLMEKHELHNVTDIKDRKRLIRALEIADYYEKHPAKSYERFPEIPNIIFGIQMDRKVIRDRITARLKERLQQGMVQEVKSLLKQYLQPEQLKYYGLEYKYLTQYVTGEMGYEEMFEKLNTAIHQFAKRQVTWFRRMEKKGIKINWLPGENSPDSNAKRITEIIKFE